MKNPWFQGLLAAALGLGLCGCARESAPPNVLLITIDTLRADHLSCYGYPRATSPALDRLASEGVRFDQASVQWPKTGPSFASILSATYPKDNRVVRQVGKPISFELRMLAEVLAEHGYTAHAVVSNGALASELAYHQGFETYFETWKLPEEEAEGSHAAVVNRQAMAAVKKIDRGRPFFLWVHYIDPHFPYAPPEPWTDKFQDDAHYDGKEKIRLFDHGHREMLGIGRKKILDGRDDLGFYVARYDAEIAYVDHEIGVLLEHLRGEGLLERTLTVVTSDHGESLGEHGYYFGHGRFGFQPGLRVPLLVHQPGVLEPHVEEAPVELVDLMPTILEAAGVELEEGRWMQGRSFLGRLRGEPPEGDARYAYAEAGTSTRRRWQKIVRDERFKLIHAPAGKDQRWIGGPGNDLALFDLREDPGETRNVAAENPEDFQRLKHALNVWWNAAAFDVWIDTVPDDAGDGEMDAETRKQLKALGYLNDGD